jgi:hypothetical protein
MQLDRVVDWRLFVMQEQGESFLLDTCSAFIGHTGTCAACTDKKKKHHLSCKIVGRKRSVVWYSVKNHWACKTLCWVHQWEKKNPHMVSVSNKCRQCDLQRFKFSGMLRCVEWYTVTSILEEHSPFIFRAKQSQKSVWPWSQRHYTPPIPPVDAATSNHKGRWSAVNMHCKYLRITQVS